MKRNKNLLIIVLILFSFCAFTITSFGEQIVTINFNGERMEFDSNPIILNDRTMVPIRAITERLGAEVDWNGEIKEVTISQDEKVIKLQIDNPIVDIDGKKIEIDVPPVIRKDRTLVPLRFISENFGADVLWDGTTYTVDINRSIINIYTSKDEIKVGDSFEIIIEMKEAFDIYSYQIDGNFNPDVAEIQSIALTDYIDGMVFKNQNSNEEGTFTLIKTKLGKVKGSSGKGELARISFIAKKEGPLSLNFGEESIKLVNSDAKFTAVKINSIGDMQIKK